MESCTHTIYSPDFTSPATLNSSEALTPGTEPNVSVSPTFISFSSANLSETQILSVDAPSYASPLVRLKKDTFSLSVTVIAARGILSLPDPSFSVLIFSPFTKVTSALTEKNLAASFTPSSSFIFCKSSSENVAVTPPVVAEEE